MAAPATRPEIIRANPILTLPNQRQVRCIVVSCELEVRKPLLRTLECLGIDVVVCNRILHAEESLSKIPVDIVFCDEHLPDGPYTDLIHAYHCANQMIRVVVTTQHGGWDLYFHALAKGAFDVIRCPCNAADVEMTVIRALREDGSLGRATA